MVECDLAKVEVAGSNPVSRSTDSVPGALCWRALCMFGSACWTSVDFFGIWRYLNFRARYPSGKGEVCKDCQPAAPANPLKDIARLRSPVFGIVWRPEQLTDCPSDTKISCKKVLSRSFYLYKANVISFAFRPILPASLEFSA